jgi:hypothetical protein
MPGREVAVIGVASSAGTHHAGQERAPAALRAWSICSARSVSLLSTGAMSSSPSSCPTTFLQPHGTWTGLSRWPLSRPTQWRKS